MQKMNVSPKMLVLNATLGLALITGCRKNETGTTPQSAIEISTAKDLEENESAGADAENIADQAMELKFSSTETPQSVIASCVTITHDSLSNPHVMTIDFGTVNCLCKDGRYRRGQIIVTYTGKYFDAGSSKTITFNNYYRNDNHIEGIRTITNMGFNTAGNMYWNISAQNMHITHPDGSSHSWNSTRTREMIGGYGTVTIYDDIYLITGSFNGTDKNGTAFIANITSPLRREIMCHFFVSGIIEITKAGKPDRTLDFGSGNCDQFATVTCNGQIKTITLK